MNNRSGIFRWLIAASLSLALHLCLLSAEYGEPVVRRADAVLRLRLSPAAMRGTAEGQRHSEPAAPSKAGQAERKEPPKKIGEVKTPAAKRPRKAEKSVKKERSTGAETKKIADKKAEEAAKIPRDKTEAGISHASAQGSGRTPPGSGRAPGDAVRSGAGQQNAVVSVSELAVKKRVKPVYPLASRKRGESGTAVLIISIDGGRVTSVSIERSSGHKALDEAAVTAVKKWEFAAAGRIKARVPITFSLKGN